jgi:hypothetical protein
MRATGLAAALLAAGCGPGGEPFHPVEGRVALAGGRSPFPGSVSFRPDPARGNTSKHHPTAELDPDGRFRLVTAGRPGAPPGWYKVLVFSAEKVGDGPYGGPTLPKWRTSPRYTDEATTPLAVEVVPDPPPGAYDFTAGP